MASVPFLEQMERVEIQVHSIITMDLIRSLLGEPAECTHSPFRMHAFQAEEHTLFNHPELWWRHASVPVTQSQLRAWLASAGGDLKFEGDRGVVWIRIGVMLDYPKGQPDSFRDQSRWRDWETLTLAGSWFPDAFIGR